MRLLPAFLLLLAAGPALAQSNNGEASYPPPKCEKPAPLDPTLKPVLPPSMAAAGANEHTIAPAGDIAYYNHKVLAYNEASRAHGAAMQVYGACIDAYVMAAKADIARIDAAIGDAMASANDP